MAKVLFALGTIAVLVVVAFFYLQQMASCPVPGNASAALVVVSSGESTREVAESLHRAGVIRSPLLFRAVARATGADGKVQAGEYLFLPGVDLLETLSILVQGKVVYHPLTIREGLSVLDIAALVEEGGFGQKEAFLAAAQDASLAPDYVPATYLESAQYPLEGYLFPDTYYIPKGTSEVDLVLMMTRRFTEVFGEDLKERCAEVGLSPHEVATLAAIVEREAQVADERAIIAAVYHNRLRFGMLLGADPTVLYAVGKEPSALVLWADLEVDSPYNTYKYVGLPPGPICNFGEACLLAVLEPAETDYLYFVAKNDGSHAFSRSFEEHQWNIATFQGR